MSALTLVKNVLYKSYKESQDSCALSYTISEENLLFCQVNTIYIKCVTESDVLFLSDAPLYLTYKHNYYYS